MAYSTTFKVAGHEVCHALVAHQLRGTFEWISIETPRSGRPVVDSQRYKDDSALALASCCGTRIYEGDCDVAKLIADLSRVRGHTMNMKPPEVCSFVTANLTALVAALRSGPSRALFPEGVDVVRGVTTNNIEKTAHRRRNRIGLIGR